VCRSVAVCRSVLQFAVVCCSVKEVWPLDDVFRSASRLCVAVCCSVVQCVAARCSVSQCVVVCCSLLQCVAVRRRYGR